MTTTAPSLRRGFAWTFSGNLVYASCQWLLLVAMAQFGNVRMVGMYALALAIVTPVVAFSSLQLRILLATDARQDLPFGAFLAVRLISSALVLLVVGATFLFGDYSVEMRMVGAGLTLMKVFDSFSDVYYGLFQQRERMDRIAKSLILHGLLQFGSFTALLLTTGRVSIAVFGAAACSLLLLLGYDMPGSRSLAQDGSTPGEFGHSGEVSRTIWNATVMRHIAWLGWPLGLVTALSVLTGNVPRYFLAEYSGETDLGIFAALFYLTVAGSMVVGAIADPASPRLAGHASRGELDLFVRLLSRLALVAATIGGLGLVVAWLAAEPLLTFVYGSEYAEHPDLLRWLMAAAIPMYLASVLGAGLNALRRFHAQVPLPVANLAVTTLLAAYLIPSGGLTGAGKLVFLAAVLSMLTTAALLFYFLRTGNARQ